VKIMLSDREIAAINSDLIDILTKTNVIDQGKISCLQNSSPSETNAELVKFLQNTSAAHVLRETLGINILEDIDVSEEALNFVGEKFAQNSCILPISYDGTQLTVAVADPFDVKLMDDLTAKFGVITTFKLTSAKKIKEFFQKKFGSSSPDSDIETNNIDNANQPATQDMDHATLLDRFFENLLKIAIEEMASDVHLENTHDGMHIRIRVDGRLRVIKTIDKILAQAVVAKIKVATNAKIDEVRLPQDKRIRMKIHDRFYDFRVAILPTIHGENVAIRIFDQEDNDFDLNNIGLFDEQLAILQSMISCKNGLILLCGPTGCGKTTTLYTILKNISSPEKKVITIEDPIEYRLDGINQVPVNEEIGLSFASILRSVLRQSPNVIMVGEIRDSKTAELAIQAALTGHLVFSTVHCSDSAGAITRLMDFKISEHLVKCCLRGAISQQLLRKPCVACATLRSLSAREKSLFPSIVDHVQNIPVMHGCDICANRGYKGRTAAFDFLINKNLPHDKSVDDKIFKKNIVFDDFIHVETFGDSIARLLKSNQVIFEDACQLMLLKNA
jgi:type IV pilus assembly protein PilB